MFRRFAALPRHQRRLVVEALLALLAARLAVLLLPFRAIASWLGTMEKPAADASPPPGEVQALLLREIRWAVGAVADRLPFTAACLPRALAARALCNRRGLVSTLHLGAQPGQTGTAETHAWLDAGSLPLTGFPLPEGMVEVGCFR